MIAKPSDIGRNSANEPKSCKVELIDEGLDDPDRVVIREIVVNMLRKQEGLAPICTLNRTRRYDLPDWNRGPTKRIGSVARLEGLMRTIRMDELTQISIRPASEEDSPKLGAVHVEAWRESYPDLVPAAMLASLSVESRTSMWRHILSGDGGPNKTMVFLAETNRQLAGFASCGLQRSEQLQADGYAGEISAIYVLKAFQNRGFGRQLMAAAGASLGRRGLTAAALWVLKDNHQARRFYERLGGRQVSSREDGRGEHVLVEVAYGWSNLEVVGGTAATGR